MDRILRIGIDARFWRQSTGGIGRYTRELLHHLVAIDQTNIYRVFLTAADLEEWDIDQRNFQPVLADIVHYSFAEQTTFWRMLEQEQLDLVHFLNFNHPILYRRPFVTTLHDLTVVNQPVGRSQKSIGRRLAFLAVLRHSLKAAKRIIAISEFSATDAEKRLNILPTKIDMVYEGAPDAEPLPFGNKAIIQEYLGTRDPYFLFVSQWRPHKGILTLLEAFAKFKSETGLPHRLVLAGKQDTSAAEVAAALQSSPVAADIISPGFIPEALLPSLYHNAAAFVFPSEYEGFGLPILEAMRYEVPLVVAENSSIPEVAGSAALYFPTGDSAGLATRLAEVVQDKALVAELLQNATLQIQRFSWSRCAEQTLHVYQHVLEKVLGSDTVSYGPRWRNR